MDENDPKMTGKKGFFEVYKCGCAFFFFPEFFFFWTKKKKIKTLRKSMKSGEKKRFQIRKTNTQKNQCLNNNNNKFK
jgi:hypothetical protein